MSQFNRDKFMKQGPYQVTPTPFPGEGIFGGNTSFAESAQSFGGNFVDYNIVTQTVDKLKGDHYTDNIAYAREQAREQEEELVGPKPLYDPFTDPKIQSLPDQFRKYGAGVESEREALAFMKTVNHYETVKKNRMRSGGASVLGMVMGELISPANIYGLKVAQSTKELAKIVGAVSAEELAQHALQPERTTFDSALNVGIIGGFNAAMLGHKKIKEMVLTRAVPDYSGYVERVVMQHFDDTIDNFKQSNTASEAEVVPDLNEAIQVQKKREVSSVNDELPMEEGELPDFQFIEEADPKLKNVDQRANPDDTIAPAWWLDKIPDGPVKRALLKGSSYGKSIMTDLVEHPFVQLKNLGENPAATQAGVDRLNAINWQAPMVDTMQQTEQLYLRYRQRVSDSSATTMTGQVVRDLRGTGDAIGFDEFLEEVGKTKGNRGARTDIQEIVESAALWHEKVYKPMGEAAKKSGMFSQNLQRARSSKLAELKEARRAGTPETVKAIRAELDDIAKQIDEADNIDLNPNFLNRIYKKDTIRSRRQEFTNILINRGGRSQEEASGIVDAILGQTARHADADIDGPVIEMGKVGRAASLKERSLDDIDDIDFGDFLEHNIFATGKYYTSRVGPDIELTRKFGSIDMHDQLKAISDAHDLRIKNAAPHEVDKFKAMKEQELDDIRVVRDRIRGTYGLPDNPDSYTNRGMRIAKMMNATTMLTGAISAIPDMARLVMYDGMTRSFGTAFDALTKNMDTLKMAKGEAQLAGEALDMYLSMRAALFTDLSDAMSSTSQFERIAGKVTQQFFNVSLMNPWNVGVKTMASLITGSRILEESIKWASPLRNSAGVPVKYGEVVSSFNGNRIAASYNPKTKEITMDLEKLRESYDRKGWTQPRNGVTPLPEKQFKTFEDFRDFVIEHELAHTDFRPNKGESIPQYEDRINQIALKRVGHRGKASAEFEQSKLAQSGIDANMAGRISAQFEQYGMREGRVMIAQTKKWKDRGAAQAYSAALGKDINTIIVTPGAGDLPSSMSGGLEKFDIAKGRKAKRVAKVESGEELNRWEKIEDTFMGPQVAQMLFQFKSFGVAATQRILVPGLQRPDKNFLIGAAGLVGLGVMVDHIRDGQLGSKRPKTSSQRLKAGIDRSGMLGWFGDANGALETLSDGRFGIGPMMGDHGYKRSKLSKLGAVAGPSVSQGKNIARLLYGLSDGSMGKRDAYYARSTMPMNRVFWADGIFDFTQSAIGPK